MHVLQVHPSLMMLGPICLVTRRGVMDVVRGCKRLNTTSGGGPRLMICNGGLGWWYGHRRGVSLWNERIREGCSLGRGERLDAVLL